MPFHRGTALAVGSFLTFGALLVLYGANGTELIAQLDLDYADLGLLGSMLSLGLGMGIVIAGPMTDRLPRQPLYFGSCLLVIAATTTLGPGTAYQTLLVHTIAIGFGAGFYETVLNALIVEEFAERAPRRLIFIHSAATLAASVTPLLFELLRGIAPIPWYDTFRIVGVAHVGLLLAVAFVPMPSRSSRNEASSAESATAIARASEPVVRSVSKDDRLALAAVCVATFAYVGVESALTLFIADHATSDLGLPASRAARTISAFWGGLLVGRLAVGLSPRSPGAGTISGLAVIAAIIVLAFGLSWIDTPEIAAALVGFFLGGVFPVMIGLAGIALPSSAGTAIGLAGGLGSLGGFVIPWFTGRLATHGGLSIGIASLSAWLLLLVTAAGFVRSRRTKNSMRNYPHLRQQG